MKYTIPSDKMRDGISRTVTAYRTRVPGLIITHGFDFSNQETSKCWLLVLESSGFTLSKTLHTRKQAKAIAAVLGGLWADWTTDIDDARKAIEMAGFKKWYLDTVQ
jgi:hypothetical protein